MSQFILRFDWPQGAGADEEATRELSAGTFEAAKMQAAMLYAGAAFRDTRPTAYRIIQNGQTEVYRYPAQA
jgi:hypothetical protein